MRELDLANELRHLKSHKGKAGSFAFAFDNRNAKLLVSSKKPLKKRDILDLRKEAGNHFATGTCTIDGMELSLNITESKGCNSMMATKKIRSLLVANGLKYKCKVNE